jgi:hypothetical protein
MTAQKGRQQQLGVKLEATRLTAETTGFTRFVPWTNFEARNVIEYEVDESAFANRATMLDKHIATRHAQFNIGGKVDTATIDFWLHTTLGASTAVTALGATTRTYTLLQSLQLPTFTAQYTRGAEGNKKLTGASPASLEISFTPEDSSYTVEGHAISETAGNAVTAVYAVSTTKLTGKNTKLYYATTQAALGTIASPTGTEFKTRSALIKIETGVDATRYYELGADTPTDNTADGYKVSLELELIHSTANAATVFQNNYDNGTPLAFRLDSHALNLPVIGTSTLRPRLVLDTPPSKYIVEPAVALDDLITQKITVEIEAAHLATLTTVGPNASI